MADPDTQPRTRRRRSQAARKPPSATEATAAADALFERAPAQSKAANAKRERGHLSPKYVRIVEQVFTMPDPDIVFSEIRDKLELESALTPALLQSALNEAEGNALTAHQLYVNTKADHERMDVELESTLGALRDAATAELQSEKDNGERSKSITEADVRGRAARMFPDEWCAGNDRKVRAKGMLEHVLRLAELWKKRRESLQAMIHAGR